MSEAIYTFKTQDGREFVVSFGNDGDEWEFVFMDAEGKMNLTGGGGAVEIFATVKEIALHFFKKYKPKKPVYFQADNDESSRVKLYNRAVKMISPALPGYKTITSNEGNHKTYLIVPEDSDEWDWRQDAN